MSVYSYIILICQFFGFHFVEPVFILFWHVSHNRSKNNKGEGNNKHTLVLYINMVLTWAKCSVC